MDAGNSRVVKFDANGEPLIAWGSKGSGEGQFDIGYDGPGRIATDAQGNVYVLDDLTVAWRPSSQRQGKNPSKVGEAFPFPPRQMNVETFARRHHAI